MRRFRELGAQGVVIGMLRPDGSLDVEHLAQLMEEEGDVCNFAQGF